MTDRSLPVLVSAYCMICGDPAPCAAHTFHETLPATDAAFDTGTIAAHYAQECNRELAKAQSEAIGYRNQIAFLQGMTETQAVKLADKQQRLDAYDQLLARYCTTIDTQRALIKELTAERDELRAERDQRISWAAGQTDCTREQAEKVLFPHTALRSAPWTPVV